MVGAQPDYGLNPRLLDLDPSAVPVELSRH